MFQKLRDVGNHAVSLRLVDAIGFVLGGENAVHARSPLGFRAAFYEIEPYFAAAEACSRRESSGIAVVDFSEVLRHERRENAVYEVQNLACAAEIRVELDGL